MIIVDELPTADPAVLQKADSSIADVIGCWTAHGATDRITLPAYTAAFSDGYRRNNDLLDEEVAAVPLFQRLRIASRACHVKKIKANVCPQGSMTGHPTQIPIFGTV